MNSVATNWRRSARLVTIGAAAVFGCGLLAACSETPKMAKKADHSTYSTSEEAAGKPAPMPSPESEPSSGASAPKPAEAEAVPPAVDDQAQAPEQEAAPREAQQQGHKKKKKAAARPSSPAGEDTESQPEAAGAEPPDAEQESAEPSGGAGPTAVEEAAPAKDATAPPPPPPAAAVPPPAAPSAAARAAIEADPNKKYKVVPVYYGTDRAIEPDPTRLQFGYERGHKLQLGRALISVPFVHKVPQIERPRVIEIPYFKIKIYAEKEDPDKHFTVQEITSLTEEQMLALVKEQLAKSSTFKDHAFVFVHGFNTSFDNALYRTAQVTYDLGFDGAPFLYSWPSGGNVASYTYDRASVEQAEPMLAQFLDMVIQKSGARSISLIAHSMGNELLLRVLERLKPKIPPGVVISQVILAAPDVDRDKFNIIAREIKDFAKGVTLYAASNDRALGYSQQFWGGVPRAGDIPKDGPLIIPGIDTIDVTAVSTDGLGLNHSGYAENPALLDDVKALVEFGIRPPDKRMKSILAVESPTGLYWRFQATN